jgi:hypothetical protein
LFASVIQELNSIEIKEGEFVNRFLKVLTLNKNASFFREVRNNQNYREFMAYAINSERPILFALFNDIKVASVNQAWRGIAEQALLEIQEEAKMDYSSLREPERETEHDTIWNYRITIAIWYFDIMVREAIRQNVNDHMWMYYYVHFLRGILNNMDDLPSLESNQNRLTRSFDLISDLFSKMMDWKDVALKSQHHDLIECVYDCMGECIYEICISEKLNNKDKQYLMNLVWEDLIKITPLEDSDFAREAVDRTINRGFEMFKRPSMLFSPSGGSRKAEAEAYLNSLFELWRERDTPILIGVLGERAKRFKTEVVDLFY